MKARLFAATLVIGLGYLTASAQIETLGGIKYTAPKGWTKSSKDHAIVFSDINPADGQFCFLTLYAESSSTGDPQKDFARDWNTRVVEPWKGDARPKVVTEKTDGWTAVAGGTQIDFQGGKAFAFLNVLSGFGKTVTVLAILNNNSYLPPFQAFVEGLEVTKTRPATVNHTNSASETTIRLDDFGRIVITPPTRQLTRTDLAGQWGEAASFHQRYVYRSSGAYAGADSLTFKSKMTLTADGGYFNDFYAIQNGKLIKEKTGGAFAINGRILVISDTNLRKYAIRGWLELPDMTVIEVNGPYYKDDAIPGEIFSNPAYGANLNQQWIRKK